MSTRYISNSYNDTILFAKRFAKRISEDDLSKGKIFLLKGELGAGKTAFVRGFASYWKIDEQVVSPTFTIVNEYKNDKVKISHIDLYRLSFSEEVEELGLLDIIEESNYSFIEWPEKAIGLLKEAMYTTIKITLGKDESERIIEIK